MIKLIAVGALSLAVVGFAGSASAGSPWSVVSATPGPFTAQGSVVVTIGFVPVNCTVTLNGVTALTGGGAKGKKPTASVTSGTIGGGLCGFAHLTGFPQKVTAKSATLINFRHVSAAVGTFGICGPGALKGTLNSGSGAITFSNAAIGGGTPCHINGSLSTSPQLSIVAQ